MHKQEPESHFARCLRGRVFFHVFIFGCYGKVCLGFLLMNFFLCIFLWHVLMTDISLTNVPTRYICMIFCFAIHMTCVVTYLCLFFFSWILVGSTVAYFFSLPAPCLPLSLDRVYLLRGNIVFNTNFLFIWINIEVCLQCVILCLVYLHHIDKVTILILCVLSIVADSLNDTWVKDRHDFFNLLFIRNYITTKIIFCKFGGMLHYILPQFWSQHI